MWIVAQTEPIREHLVRLLVMRAGLETYLPRIRHRQMTGLLYPAYLFVRLVDQHWYGVAKTPHVVRLLPSNERPGQVPEELLRELKRRERDGFVRIPRTPGLRKGQPVRIVAGSFEGSTALFDGQSAHDRVRVFLDLMGRAVPVELPARDLIPVHEVRLKS